MIVLIETRDFGILDLFGGEVWEASLLLSAYLIKYKAKYVNKRVLELGSGIGLPGLLLAELMLLKDSNSSSRSITLSDNDPRVIVNLSDAIISQFSISGTCHETNNNNPNLELNVKLLDWRIFDDDLHQASFHGNSLAKNLDYDYIIGSALRYLPYHACLANLIK